MFPVKPMIRRSPAPRMRGEHLSEEVALQTVTLEVRGLFDVLDHLVVEKQLLKCAGVLSAHANPASENVTIRFDEDRISTTHLRHLIESCGFSCPASSARPAQNSQ